MPTLRPATRADIDQLIDEPLPWRIRAYAIEHDEKVLAVGGFAYQPNDVIAAFLLKADGIEKYPVMLHKAGIRAMLDARKFGYRRIVALAEKTNPAAERWLARFGFRQVMVEGEKAWVWEAVN